MPQPPTPRTQTHAPIRPSKIQFNYGTNMQIANVRACVSGRLPASAHKLLKQIGGLGNNLTDISPSATALWIDMRAYLVLLVICHAAVSIFGRLARLADSAERDACDRESLDSPLLMHVPCQSCRPDPDRHGSHVRPISCATLWSIINYKYMYIICVWRLQPYAVLHYGWNRTGWC